MTKSVMIVDDNESIRQNLRRLFRSDREWTVCAEVDNGRDAIREAEVCRPDFIVLDFSMPQMDGLETAARLKRIHPNSSIVMFTAFKDKYLEQQAYKAGVTWVLSKSENVNKVLEFARILSRPDAHPPTKMANS